MQKLIAISALSLGVLGLIGCTTTPSTGQSELEVRHSGTPVIGSSFQCTGTWPSSLTPCGYAWSSQPVTQAIIDGTGVVRLALGRSPIPIDGGASTVDIELTVGAGGLVGATAQESTSRPGTAQVVERSDPTTGWIDPVAIGTTTGARNAGRFSLTFAWGSISGTYDTAPPQ